MCNAEANDAGAITKSDGKAVASCRTPTNANKIAAADRALVRGMQRPYKEKTAAKAAALCNRSYFDLKVLYHTT